MDRLGIVHYLDENGELVEKEDSELVKRLRLLSPPINNVITALGGFEGETYVLGDECYGCLKDLKKFWRNDDTDDDRAVARIFWKARVLPNDLVPILLETAGKGRVTDKCAVACADIITAMTWPIDLAAELKELDDEFDKGTDYTHLLQSHLHYKAALLRPGVISALFAILLPSIAKEKKDRKERDSQIVNVILHLFRNLAFIKDRPSNAHSSIDQVEFSSLQSKLVKVFSEAHVMDLLITIASNASDPFFNQWNTLALETIYLLYRGVNAGALAMDQAKRSSNTLSQLLAAENKIKLENARTASSRHSRFGTTISVSLNSAKARTKPGDNDNNESMESTIDPRSQKVVLHRQQALNKEAGTILDMRKRKTLKTKKVDELGLEDNLNIDAKNILQGVAKDFLRMCFNTFFGSILKDIKSERPKIMEKDHIRLLFVTRWFIEFFLALRTKAFENKEQVKKQGADDWDFGLVSEVLERSWIVWILKRMREAVEQKPKAWTELQAGIECLTQLLALIDNMHNTEIEDADLAEAASLLQQQIIYNGEVLDISVDALRTYKEGVQSLRYLDASIRLGYSLLRMLEKWSKERSSGELLVRRKKAKRKKRKAADAEDEEMEMPVEQESDEEIEKEMIFTFESFEAKFANNEITESLLAYLSRYEEFTAPEQMKRVVNLIHRQVVRSKAEGLLFKVSSLNLFRSILARQAMLPKEQPYKDLVALINFVLRKFFKAVAEEPLTIVEAFFPKNRSRWKKFSSWEPEEKESKRGRDDPSKIPAEVKVKKGYSWSQQLGIAIACLVGDDKRKLVEWVKEILLMCIGQRQRIVEEIDGSSSTQMNELDEEALREGEVPSRLPSAEAMSKFEDYVIPYETDEKASAATRNPHLKLLFRLSKFSVADENADELEWYIPAAIVPAELESCLRVITQFLESPIDLSGEKPSSLLSKRTRRRQRRRRSPSQSGAELNSESEAEVKKRKSKKKKEKEVYKSAQFIEDSDAEYGDNEAFWAKERAQREKTERMAAEGQSAGMRSTGTKKRKKARGIGKMETKEEDSNGLLEDDAVAADDGDEGGQSKKRSRSSPLSDDAGTSDSDDAPLGVDAVLDKVERSAETSKNNKGRTKAKAKPKPRPAYRSAASKKLSATPSDPEPVDRIDVSMLSDEDDDLVQTRIRRPKTKAIVISDEDDSS